jgi:hypothetical protein
MVDDAEAEERPGAEPRPTDDDDRGRSSATTANVIQRWGVVTKKTCQKRSDSCTSRPPSTSTPSSSGQPTLATTRRSMRGENRNGEPSRPPATVAPEAPALTAAARP